MKVIHLISGGDTGGAKTHVHSLLANLSATLEITMVCFTSGPFVEEARALGIRTEVIPGKNLFRTLRRLEEMIRSENFSIIHSHGARGNMIAAMLSHRTGLPTVSTVHSDYRLDYLGRPFSRITYGAINTIALRLMDYRIGVSDAMVDLLITRGFRPDRLFTIYNGLDFSPRPSGVNRADFFRAVGLNADENSVVVGIAARLNPVKDISTLIRAFAIAHKEVPNLRLLIAGDGEEEDLLKKLAADLAVSDTVCLAGWISDTDAFYHAIDINTLTSLSEGFPYALIEGARAALPTISSRVGGVPYLIDHGANGFLFPVGNANALAEHLITLARDPQLRQSMGQQLYNKAKKQLSLEAIISRQIEIYDTILHHKKQDQVLICGAYGKGNAGDDAILLAILAELRALNPDLLFRVLSRNPHKTRLSYRVNATYTFNIPKILYQMRKSKLYINGGGSLMQDITSWRSLWFYLFSLFAAKHSGCSVLMYGCGIGPITSPSNRSLTARTIQHNVDAVTLRDPLSMQELKDMGVTRPKIALSADPTVILPAASPEIVAGLMKSCGLAEDGHYAAFILRPWTGFDEKVPVLAAAAEYVYNTYGLTPVFFAIEPRLDVGAAKKVIAQLTVPHYFLPNAYPAEQTIGLLSHMQMSISMRLHGLIFSAGQGVPLVGVVYDPKISSFLSYIGQDLYVNLSNLTETSIKTLIDSAFVRGKNPPFLAESVAKLRAAEEVNSQTAADFLSLS